MSASSVPTTVVDDATSVLGSAKTVALTVPWIDPISADKQQVLVALHLFDEAVTMEQIASSIDHVDQRFGLRELSTVITTDNNARLSAAAATHAPH
jgi:hypothetical protein